MAVLSIKNTHRVVSLVFPRSSCDSVHDFELSIPDLPFLMARKARINIKVFDKTHYTR
jgi:hypothetical protein